MRLALANCSTSNFEIGCQNASTSIALTKLLRLPLELYSEKSLLMCFLYLLKIFSYTNIGEGRRLLGYYTRGCPSEKFLKHWNIRIFDCTDKTSYRKEKTNIHS